MKNLFKNLMLVAVAAMAFTACQNDNEEVNKVDKVTVIEFTADLNATRSAFTGEKGETGYQSVWDGGEKVEVIVGGYLPNNDGNVTITTEDGVQGRFRAEFTSSLPAEGDIEAYVPAEGWADLWDNEVGGYVMTPQIPGEQTPSANSVDPAAHLLKSVQSYTGGVAANANLVFEHGVAYAKMTLNLGEVVAFANIASVVVDIDGNQRYTLLPTKLTEATFWFACKACEPTAMTVTITDKSDVTYVKELDLANAGKALTFENGVVSTFTVGGFEEAVLEYVTSISASYNEWSSRYEFSIDTVDGARMWPYLYVAAEKGLIPEGEYVYEDSCGSMYADIANWKGYANFNGYIITVSQLEDGYEIDFFLMDTDDNEYEFSYSGVITGINNPPAPETIASEATLETLNGSYNGYGNEASYRFEYEVAGDNEDVWAIEVTIYGDDAMGIIPAATYTNLVGTATLKDTTWNFAIDDANSSVTVAHDGENYVVTFDLVDLNGSTYKNTFTGVITKDEYNGLLQPGAATPLTTPQNLQVAVTATTATFSWDVVSGAGSYEVWYSLNGEESEHQTVTATSVEFTGLAMKANYTFYVKAIPADETKNTESQEVNTNATTLFDVSKFEAEISKEYNAYSKGESNLYTFSNDSGDTLAIPFDPNLLNLGAGDYIDNWGWAYTGGTTADYNKIAVNYGAGYMAEIYALNVAINEDVYTITLAGKVVNSDYTQTTFKGVFTGAIAAVEMEVVEALSATAVDRLGSGQYQVMVTFTLPDDHTVALAFKTGDSGEVNEDYISLANMYITPGAWQASDWQQPNWISYAWYDGVETTSINDVTVGYENGEYTFDFIVNMVNYKYTGVVTNLEAPAI